jgi:hypothetical protein
VTAPTPAQVRAYDEGRQAYIDGADSLAVADLYPAGSDLRTLWVRGWMQCRAEARYDRPPVAEEIQP